MTPTDSEIINWKTYANTRDLLGTGFVRILGYFREDGVKSLAQIEEALRLRDSSKLVIPAHTLKGEAWQFGAEKLAELAEEIEMTARHYIEIQQDPEDLLEKAVLLRPLFEATLDTLEKESNPLVERRAVNSNRGFGNYNYGS